MNELMKNKWVWAMSAAVILIVVLCLLIATVEHDEGVELQVNQQASTIENTQATQESTSENITGYFLVKANDEGKVEVFWIDASGEHLHQETTIAFSLLSMEDQELLKSGVKLEDEQDLAGFLENFDS